MLTADTKCSPGARQSSEETASNHHLLPVFSWRRYQQPQAQRVTPWTLRSARRITQLPEAGLECTDLRAETFQLGPTAQDGAANWEGSPGGREWITGERGNQGRHGPPPGARHCAHQAE